ncbi:hypothetical protein [Amycolatopsis alba]|uniref:Transcriptional regulator n=1 Tax=Amycolatopsis alba DSM 44262 TaxID=1125972 RepID=A0A229R9S4_AMYAL|nr:hypothetical protein [Amycolatopsis alba]OXM43164.1 hypothetical protein CFP75_39890 [Amycolatopsis alba DSM 44262]
MVPNHLLRDLLTESGWTGQKLANRTNALGAELGLQLHYDRTAVAHWLSGSRPRTPVPELVAEAFTRHLGRRLTVSEVGFAPITTVSVPPGWGASIVAELTKLCQDGAASRSAVSGSLYSLAALSIPDWAELAAAATVSLPTDRRSKVGRTEVEAARAMLRLFSAADLSFGGGHARPALAHYLRSTIGPWLRANAAPSVRTDLLTAAAQLCYLCGFLCFDDELHGTAQRYYLAALRLAHEAGDATQYAISLRALSVQARMLGHRRHAVNLALNAVRALPAHAPARTRAFLTGQVAVAKAAADEQHQAVRHLLDAENYLSRDDALAAPVGTYHCAALSHHHAAVRACLGERDAAISALTRSLHRRPSGERRARAITSARLAELYFAAGELERACHTWGQFLDDYPHLCSGRADVALTSLRSRLRPYAGRHPALTVARRATELRRSRPAGRP